LDRKGIKKIMEIEKTYTFEEVKKNIMYFSSELINESSNSFVLLQYGPYLVLNKIDYFYSNLPSIKNDILKLMVYVGKLIDICEERKPIGNIKKEIVSVVKSIENFKYKHRVHEIGTDFIANIQKEQLKNKILESAILNFAPIVLYSGTLKPPETTASDYNTITQSYEPDFSELDRLIEEYVFDNIVGIMKMPEAFINIDYLSEIGRNSNIGNIPMDFIHLHHEMTAGLNIASESEKIIKMYFVLVYLRYVVRSDGWRDFFNDVFKINNIYNKISKGERINLPVAMEALSKVSPSNLAILT